MWRGYESHLFRNFFKNIFVQSEMQKLEEKIHKWRGAAQEAALLLQSLSTTETTLAQLLNYFQIPPELLLLNEDDNFSHK
jgi:hypothetical protein